MTWYIECLIRFFKQKCMHSYIQTGTSTIFKTASNNRLVKFKTSTKNRGFDLNDDSLFHSYTFYDRILLSFKRTCGRTLVVYYYLFNLLSFKRTCGRTVVVYYYLFNFLTCFLGGWNLRIRFDEFIHLKMIIGGSIKTKFLLVQWIWQKQSISVIYIGLNNTI